MDSRYQNSFGVPLDSSNQTRQDGDRWKLSRGFRRSFPPTDRMKFSFKKEMKVEPKKRKLTNSQQNDIEISNKQLKNCSGERYFNKILTKMVDNSPTTYQHDGGPRLTGGETGSASRKMGLKRKSLPCLTSGFISLDSSGPSSKYKKFDKNNNSSVYEISSDEESSLSSLDQTCENSDFGSNPFTLKEAERMFMSDSLSSQIHEFFTKNRQRESFLQQKQQLRTALEKAINRTITRESHLVLVGSSINGFGRVTSDADFCLVIDKYQEKIENRSRVMKTLRSLQQLLRRAPFAQKIQLIPAKVPILKFVDSFSGMECDINVNNLTGIRNTELVKRYAMLDPRVQPLTLVIKEWAHQHGINDASQGTLSSYSLVLMVIHFLQCGVHPSVLPSLQTKHPEFFRSSTPFTEIERKGKSVRSYRSRNEMNLFQLLQKFFEYFAEDFDFENVISVRLGKTLKISDVVSPWGKEWQKPVRIEEPFDRSNTARAVYSVENGKRIFKQFRNAMTILRRKRTLEALLPNFTSSKSRNDSSIVIFDD